MEYRCVCTSVEGFVQQLVTCYLPHGYWFYVSGRVPDGKNPQDVDCKLLGKYGMEQSRQSRARRKAAGFANLHYLRYERSFLLVATHGKHPFFEEEHSSIRDARRTPIRVFGYSIRVVRGDYLRKPAPDAPAPPDGKWRVRVQIEYERYRDLKAYFLDVALRRSADQIGAELFSAPYEPYAPVRQQSLNMLRLVNKARHAAGMKILGSDAVRYQRSIVRPFEPEVPACPGPDGPGIIPPSEIQSVFDDLVLPDDDKWIS